MRHAINIVWFKRDLRAFDHAPLTAAARSGLPIIPLYVVEPEYWQQPDAARRHWHFIHDSLSDLNQVLTGLGQPLVIRRGEVTAVLTELAKKYHIRGIYAHEETGNGWTFNRDKAVMSWCQQQAIALHEYPCNGVVRRLKSRDMWSKIRNARMAEPCLPLPEKLTPVPDIPLGILPAQDDRLFGPPVPGNIQAGGREQGLKVLGSFLTRRGEQYLYHLSAPGRSEHHCSRLSAHLAWGTLSVREVVKATDARRKSLRADESKAWKRNLAAFSSRLSWRCHFIQKLEDRPALEFHCMHPAFEGMRGADHNPTLYRAWQQGKTGYPFVDACMRQLTHEGWITFRMRAMLVSFASYHLWLDWRVTGPYLAQLFTDYEPGIHYSQLQMQSGVTGINSVRIYNPLKQSQEHDPDGVFIRKWCPELKNIPRDWIHEPWQMPENLQQRYGCLIGQDYPAPVVDQATAVAAARAKIAAVRRSDGFKEGAQKVYQKLGSRKRPTATKKSTRQQLDSGQLSLFSD